MFLNKKVKWDNKRPWVCRWSQITSTHRGTPDISLKLCAHCTDEISWWNNKSAVLLAENGRGSAAKELGTWTSNHLR